MSLASADNVSSIKIGRVTEQSVAMMRQIKKFINVQFKIEECEDNVYSSESEDEEQQNNDNDNNEDESGDDESKEDSRDARKIPDKDKPEFPKAFIFSCIGIGLTNIARKTE